MGPVCLHSCLFRSFLVPNVSLQLVHWNGLSSKWSVFTWSLNCCTVENTLLHMLHWCFSFISWALTCILKPCLEKKFFSQIGQVWSNLRWTSLMCFVRLPFIAYFAWQCGQSKGFSPVWVLSWTINSLFEANFLVQNKHVYCLIPKWTCFWCLFMFLMSVNIFWQMSHFTLLVPSCLPLCCAKVSLWEKVFGHKSQAQTLDYLCIQDEEIAELYGMEL